MFCAPFYKRRTSLLPIYIGDVDTPAHSGPTADISDGADSCWQDLQPSLNTCPDDVPLVDAGPDPIDNYMNYLSGLCYELYGRFTAGQSERMLAQYETFRYRGIVY